MLYVCVQEGIQRGGEKRAWGAGIRRLNIAMLRELQEAFWCARQSEAEKTEVLLTPLRDALLDGFPVCLWGEDASWHHGSDRADPV